MELSLVTKHDGKLATGLYYCSVLKYASDQCALLNIPGLFNCPYN